MNRANWATESDGINDKIISVNANIPTSCHFEAWVYHDALGKYVISKSAEAAGNNIYFSSGTTAGGNVLFAKYTGSWHSWQTTATPISTGGWYHISLFYTAGTGSSIKCYVNGIAYTGSWTSGNGNTAGSNPSDNIRFHWQKSGGATDRFDGKMADIRLWDAEQSQDLVQQRMYKRLLGNETNLYCYLPLDEGTGTSATDQSGNSRTGTLSGSIAWVQGAPISGTGSVQII